MSNPPTIWSSCRRQPWAIVCFRRRPAGTDNEGELEQLNSALVAGLGDSGEGLVSSTRLFGRYALRVCVLNHTTTRNDVEHVLRWLETTSVDSQHRSSPEYPRAADVTAGWPVRPVHPVESLRGLPLFVGVEDDWLTWVSSVARSRTVDAGEDVLRQWEIDRDFYLLISGEADVYNAGQHIATMRSGDFFGELAVLDWGASFAYPRLATVRARTEMRLLVLTNTHLSELMASVPEVDSRIRAAAGKRLARG